MKSLNSKISNNDYKAVLWLINKHFWKSKIGPICTCALPLFFMIIYKILSDDTNSMFMSGLASYFSFSILPLCLIAMPQMIVELKTSIILRKISVSSVSALKFCFILATYYICCLIISNLMIVVLFAIFVSNNAKEIFSLINWGEITYALLNIYIVALSFGLLLGIIIKKNNYVQVVGFVVMMISVVFSGQFIPITVLARTDAIRYISLFSPITYPLSLLNNITIPTQKEIILTLPHIPELNQQIEQIKNYTYNGLFDIHNEFIVFDFLLNNEKVHQIIKIKESIIYYQWQNIMNLVMPWVITIVCAVIGLKKFNWTSR